MGWWSPRLPLELSEIRPEDVDRYDSPSFSGIMRLRLQYIDPNDIDTDFTQPQRQICVEFDRVDDELWCCAFNIFCNECFEPDDYNDPQSNFTQVRDQENADRILDEFHPEGTMIHITNYYEVAVKRYVGEVEFTFWKPRNPQSKRRIRDVFATWVLNTHK